MLSSVIEKFLYDGAARRLRVFFISGAVYDYLKVPAAIYQQFRAAASKGIFLHEFIKGHYSFRKIN